jgi:hypothetical protein
MNEPEDLASNVDISLTLLKQQIANNQLVPGGPFAMPPVAMAAVPPPPPIVK